MINMNEYQKYQDALDRIGSDATNYHLSFSTLSSVIILQEKETMADRELLQELVNKEKPMNICFKRIGNEDVPYCPRCKRKLVDDHLTYYNYCPSCGQRLK